MPDAAPENEPPTSTLISHVISFSVALLGGLVIVLASFTSAGGDWFAPMSFRGIVSVPMWVPFLLGLALLALSVGLLIAPVRLLVRRARSRRRPDQAG